MILFMLLFQHIPFCYDISSRNFLPLIPCNTYKYSNKHYDIIDKYHICCDTYDNNLCNKILNNNNTYYNLYEFDDCHDDKYDISNNLIYYEHYKYLDNLFYDVYISKIKCRCSQHLLEYACNNITYCNDKYYPINIKHTMNVMLNFEQRMYLMLNNLIILNDKSKRNQLSDNVIDNIIILFLSLINLIIA